MKCAASNGSCCEHMSRPGECSAGKANSVTSASSSYRGGRSPRSTAAALVRSNPARSSARSRALPRPSHGDGDGGNSDDAAGAHEARVRPPALDRTLGRALHPPGDDRPSRRGVGPALHRRGRIAAHVRFAVLGETAVDELTASATVIGVDATHTLVDELAELRVGRKRLLGSLELGHIGVAGEPAHEPYGPVAAVANNTGRPVLFSARCAISTPSSIPLRHASGRADGLDGADVFDRPIGSGSP